MFLVNKHLQFCGMQKKKKSQVNHVHVRDNDGTDTYFQGPYFRGRMMKRIEKFRKEEVRAVQSGVYRRLQVVAHTLQVYAHASRIHGYMVEGV